MTQHFISLADISPEVFRTLLDNGIAIKQNPDPWREALKGKTLAMIFQKNSTRTRFSFEVGMFQLGGHAVFAPTQYTQIDIADVEDEAQVISRFVDVIVARMRYNRDLVNMANASRVPVINGCDERYHPVQALTDLMTLKEKLGRTEGLRVVYVGIGNNVSNSLGRAVLYAGGHFTLCAPEIEASAYDDNLMEMLRQSRRFLETPDLDAVAGADVLYTDTWISMEHFNDPWYSAERERRINMMRPYQLNEVLLKRTGRTDTLIMHCLPAHRGYEIDAALLHHPNAIMFDQAENRLHAQKALLLWLLGKL